MAPNHEFEAVVEFKVVAASFILRSTKVYTCNHNSLITAVAFSLRREVAIILCKHHSPIARGYSAMARHGAV
jgi:hypothetical protein